MPLLLEDLAKETSESTRRIAARLDEEAQQLTNLLHGVSSLEELAEKIRDSARLATHHAITRLTQAEGVWRSALLALPSKSNEESIRLLRHLVRTFEAGKRLCRSPLALWKLAEEYKIVPENHEELETVEQRFTELAKEARLALEHRTEEWRPTDPERLTQGLKEAREGRGLKADEAKKWFRRQKS